MVCNVLQALWPVSLTKEIEKPGEAGRQPGIEAVNTVWGGEGEGSWLGGDIMAEWGKSGRNEVDEVHNSLVSLWLAEA